MEGNQYCILWNNYQGSLIETIGELKHHGLLVDVTIVCSDGRRIQAHQLVLAACSTFFKEFIKDNPSKHPIVLLPSGILYSELKSMMEFMYTGQVCVQQDRLQAFIKSAHYLRIKGLEDSGEKNGDDVSTNTGNETQRSRSKNGTNSDGANIKVESDTVRFKEKTKDQNYKQQSNIGESIDGNQKWEIVDRKPVIFPVDGKRRRAPKKSFQPKQPMHLSDDIVCYEKRDTESKENSEKDEPINKIRRIGLPGHVHDDDLDLCTCTSRKVWSVSDMEKLCHVWKETLSQVPPSYFIRSISLCKEVARRLQNKGVKKNWRQCQVKMKNLRQEIKIYKEGVTHNQLIKSRKPSEVMNACKRFLPSIEDIFDKEEEIRRLWYEKREDKSKGNIANIDVNPSDILAQVAVLADSDEEDADVHHIEPESEVYTEPEVGMNEIRVHTMDVNEVTLDDEFVNTIDVPHHRIHTGPDGIVHHIIEDIHSITIPMGRSNDSNGVKKESEMVDDNL